MKEKVKLLIGLILFLVLSCSRNDFNDNIEIPEFDFPKTIDFEDSLTHYNIFEGIPSDLSPSKEFELLELSSELFTDYSYKQRLVKIPTGTELSKGEDGSFNFPNGSILVKTFFYYEDERNKSLGKRIIETRLEIKNDDLWNAATYLWNSEQTEAILKLDGFDTPITWTDQNGIHRSTIYHVPSENERMTCHQSNSKMTPLGPTIRNLNRNVLRNGSTLNQLSHLQNIGILRSFSVDQSEQIVNYKDLSKSLEDRARAYLAMNCAHCHNPNSWEKSDWINFDFRYETPLNQTGILSERNDFSRAIQNGEMPLIGTTILDEEGVNLLLKYLEEL